MIYQLGRRPPTGPIRVWASKWPLSGRSACPAFLSSGLVVVDVVVVAGASWRFRACRDGGGRAGRVEVEVEEVAWSKRVEARAARLLLGRVCFVLRELAAEQTIAPCLQSSRVNCVIRATMNSIGAAGGGGGGGGGGPQRGPIGADSQLFIIISISQPINGSERPEFGARFRLSGKFVCAPTLANSARVCARTRVL